MGKYFEGTRMYSLQDKIREQDIEAERKAKELEKELDDTDSKKVNKKVKK